MPVRGFDSAQRVNRSLWRGFIEKALGQAPWLIERQQKLLYSYFVFSMTRSKLKNKNSAFLQPTEANPREIIIFFSGFGVALFAICFHHDDHHPAPQTRYWSDPRLLSEAGSLEAFNHCIFKSDRKASPRGSPGRSLARSSVSQRAEVASAFRGLPPCAALSPRELPPPRRPGELSRLWEVGRRPNGRCYWLVGRRRRGGASVIGGGHSRRGRGRYIREVPAATQAVGLLECGDVAGLGEPAGGRAGEGVAGRARRLRVAGQWSVGLQPPEGQPRRARNWV